MTETPFQSYALLGSGRVARHFHFYLKSLNLPVLLWSRNGDPDHNSSETLDAGERLHEIIAQSSHVLCALKDDAIAQVMEPWRDSQKVLVHFSGALNLPFMRAAHPLMTFGPELEELDWYRALQFVLDEGVTLHEVLPGLPNRSWSMSPQLRPYYHALCTLAGNASFLLWHNIGEEFEKSLGLPRQLLTPFLHQVVANSGAGAMSGFTGPVARGDWATVRRHLDSLHGNPDLLKAYRHYLELANNNNHTVPGELL